MRGALTLTANPLSPLIVINGLRGLAVRVAYNADVREP